MGNFSSRLGIFWCGTFCCYSLDPSLDCPLWKRVSETKLLQSNDKRQRYLVLVSKLLFPHCDNRILVTAGDTEEPEWNDACTLAYRIHVDLRADDGFEGSMPQ